MQTHERRPRRLAHFLSDHDITRTWLAGDIGQSTANVSRKLRGDVPLTVQDLVAIRCSVSRRIGRVVAWDEILDAPVDLESAVVA